MISGSDKFNTTIFVGGVDPYMTEDELKGHFLPFGGIVSVKVIQFYIKNNNLIDSKRKRIRIHSILRTLRR